MPNYIINRLSETSTWRGLILLLTSAGVAVSPEQGEKIVAAGLALVGLINVFRKEPKSPDAAAPDQKIPLPGARLTLTLLLGALFLPGCATTPGGNPQTIALVARLSGAAVRTGAAFDMQNHPDHRPYYEAAKVALDRLVDSSTWDAAKFAAVLGALPIKEFHGAEGVLTIQGLVLLYDIGSTYLYDPASQPALQATMTAVRNGLSQALGPASAVIRRTPPKPTAIPANAKRIKI